MVQRHLVVVDEQSQKERLKRICNSLKGDGVELIYKEINPEFTHDNSKKKKKTLSETDMYIKAYKKQKKLRKEMEDDDDDFGTVKIEN